VSTVTLLCKTCQITCTMHSTQALAANRITKSSQVFSSIDPLHSDIWFLLSLWSSHTKRLNSSYFFLVCSQHHNTLCYVTVFLLQLTPSMFSLFLVIIKLIECQFYVSNFRSHRVGADSAWPKPRRRSFVWRHQIGSAQWTKKSLTRLSSVICLNVDETPKFHNFINLVMFLVTFISLLLYRF
jgi:hypothetical protein